MRKLETHLLAMRKRKEGVLGKNNSLEQSSWKLPTPVGWALFGNIFLASYSFCRALLKAAKAGLQLDTVYRMMAEVRHERLERGRKNTISHKRPVLEWQPRDVEQARQRLGVERKAPERDISTGSQNSSELYTLPDTDVTRDDDISEELNETAVMEKMNTRKCSDYGPPAGAKKRKTSKLPYQGADQQEFDHLGPSPTSPGTWTNTIRAAGHPEGADAVENSSITSLEHSSSEVTEMWSACGGLPKILPSSRLCAGIEKFDTRSLLAHCLSTKSFQLWQNSVVMTDKSDTQKKSLLGLLATDYHEEHPTEHRISADFSTLPENYAITIPTIQEDPIPQLPEETAAILTARGGLTDVHIDDGMCVVSSPIGKSQRLFFLWPPTEANRSAMQEIDAKGQRLALCCKHLQGGLIILLDETVALRMRAGTFHAVLTLVGGFIVTRGYVDTATLLPMSQFLANIQPRGTDMAYLATVVRRWVTVAEFSSLDDILRGWQVAAEFLSHTIHSAAIRKLLQSFWKSMAATYPGNTMVDQITESVKKTNAKPRKG